MTPNTQQQVKLMKHSAIFVVIGAMVLMWVGFLVGKQSTKATTTPTEQAQTSLTFAPITMTVQATTPTVVSVPDSLTTSGVMHAKDVAEVSAKITGATIERILVDVGDTVQMGQVLAILDNSTLKDNLAQATADHAQTLASLEQAKADLARVEPLLAMDAVSRQQVDSHRTAVKQAEASQVASLARLNTAKNNLKNTQITAPVAGIISTKTAQVGTAVAGTPLFGIIKGGQLEWQATLPPADAERLTVGQIATLSVGSENLTGHITHLSPVANSGRELIVHVAMPAHPLLKVGTYHQGTFTLSEQTLPAIPATAVITTDGHHYVYTLTPHNLPNQTSPNDKAVYQLARTRIDVLARMGDKVATNLPTGTLIVANGVSFLNDRELVHITPMVGADNVQNVENADNLNNLNNVNTNNANPNAITNTANTDNVGAQ